MDPERIQYSKLNDTQTATVYGVYVKWCEIADLVDVIANIMVFFKKYILERDILQSAFNSMSVKNKTLEKKEKKGNVDSKWKRHMLDSICEMFEDRNVVTRSRT